MKTEPIELLDGAYRPITNTVGFLECSASAAADAFFTWMDRTYSRDGRRLRVNRVETESLAAALDTLLPLTSHSTRWLFVDTQSDWCAYIENCWRGTDSTPIAPLASRVGCRGIHCTNAPVGESPATIFEVYEPRPNRYWNTKRSIYASKDGSRWVFGASGDAFEFEQTERYEERRKRDRFTPEMLDQYLGHFGISPFDESFYCNSNCVAYLVDIEGPPLPNIKEYSLNEA